MRMLEWDYSNPNFVELKYEDLIQREDELFPKAFRKYGFDDWAIERCMEVVARYNFGKISGRNLGKIKERSHLRSGQTGQWTGHLTDDHLSYFEQLYGNALKELGYQN